MIDIYMPDEALPTKPDRFMRNLIKTIQQSAFSLLIHQKPIDTFLFYPDVWSCHQLGPTSEIEWRYWSCGRKWPSHPTGGSFLGTAKCFQFARDVPAVESRTLLGVSVALFLMFYFVRRLFALCRWSEKRVRGESQFSNRNTKTGWKI